MPKKPTGEIGPNRLTMKESGPELSWERVVFAERKEEIEQAIVDLFVKQWTEAGASISARRCREDCFDYELEAPGGPSWLELAELVYREDGAPPYRSRSMRLEIGPYVDQLLQLIQKKSNKYGAQNGRPIDLLVYITHWRFLSCEEAIRLVQHRLRSCRLNLGYVFLLEPVTSDEIRLRLLNPPPDDPLEGASPGDLDGHWWLNADPSEWFSLSPQ